MAVKIIRSLTQLTLQPVEHIFTCKTCVSTRYAAFDTLGT
jgi:hypothetical protein